HPLDVAARAEYPARAGQDQDARLHVGVDAIELSYKLLIHDPIDRVFRVWVIDCDDDDTVVALFRRNELVTHGSFRLGNAKDFREASAPTRAGDDRRHHRPPRPRSHGGSRAPADSPDRSRSRRESGARYASQP